MVLKKGGYQIIDSQGANVYELAYEAVTSGKPILWYETDTKCYYIDTIELDGTNVILTKGGKTITIASDGTVTSEGEIQPSGSGNSGIILKDLISFIYGADSELLEYLNIKVNNVIVTPKSVNLLNLDENTLNILNDFEPDLYTEIERFNLTPFIDNLKENDIINIEGKIVDNVQDYVCTITINDDVIVDQQTEFNVDIIITQNSYIDINIYR